MFSNTEEDTRGNGKDFNLEIFKFSKTIEVRLFHAKFSRKLNDADTVQDNFEVGCNKENMIRTPESPANRQSL
jgi:hypothetical protein